VDDLVANLDPKAADAVVEASHSLLDAVRIDRVLWVRRPVVHEVRVMSLAVPSRSPGM
jgi:hypothetical protein